jgi:ATP-dependent 26S proteasome regulatory subunit
MADIDVKDIKTYKDNYEYLADELERLELEACILMFKQSFGRSESTLGGFKGIVLSEEEIQNLLGNESEEYKNEPEYIQLKEQLLQLDSSIREKRKKSSLNHTDFPLEHLVNVFHLSFFEVQCIVLVLAVELDIKFEKLYAFLQDDITIKHPTVNLALNLFCSTKHEMFEARRYFGKGGALERYFFHESIDDSPAVSLLSRTLKLDRGMVDYLLYGNIMDNDISNFIEFINSDLQLPELISGLEIQDILDSILNQRLNTKGEDTKAFVIYLWGASGVGKRFSIKHFCMRFKLPLMLVDVKGMAEDNKDFVEAIRKVERAALLTGGVLCFYNFNMLLEGNELSNDSNGGIRNANSNRKIMELFKSIKSFSGIVFILADCEWREPDLTEGCHYLSIKLNVPAEADRKLLWETFAKSCSFDNNINWGVIASKFKFTHGQIISAIEAAADMAGYCNPENAMIGETELNAACFMQSKHNSGHSTVRVESKYLWEDIILPQNVVDQLKNICNQMKFKNVVYGEWGFDRKLSYGKGLCVLLFGPPGTGKTLTAQVMANELKLELFRIDLSQVISKYIGETEKNLQMIFKHAEMSNAILFFDEADAIFGKRSEVKDAHDRYANMETSYLLQKVEEYEGMTILATNFKENIDDAFTRRIQHMVEFPFPDSIHREKIWRMLFPEEAPVDEDIDFEFIAKRFEIAGGNIKNIVVSSAFLAAQANEKIQMKHIVRAVKYELHKTGRVLLKEDLGEYYPDL